MVACHTGISTDAGPTHVSDSDGNVLQVFRRTVEDIDYYARCSTCYRIPNCVYWVPAYLEGPACSIGILAVNGTDSPYSQGIYPHGVNIVYQRVVGGGLGWGIGPCGYIGINYDYRR